MGKTSIGEHEKNHHAPCGATLQPLWQPQDAQLNHWAADGIHTKHASPKRVAIGVGLIIGAAFAMFQGISLLTRDENPRTISKEWRAAQAKRHRERQMMPISNHKVG